MSNEYVPKGTLTASEIPHYTDRIQIGSLGAPIGFNDDQLLFNVRGFRRVLAAAHMGNLVIDSYDGEQSSVDIGVTSVGNGQAAAVGREVRSTTATQRSGLKYDPSERHLGRSYGFPDALVHLNRHEIDDRADNHRSQSAKGALDPFARAAAIDSLVKAGLSELVMRRTLSGHKAAFTTLGLTAACEGLEYKIHEGVLTSIASTFIFLQLGNSLRHLTANDAPYRLWMKSLFPGSAIDRYLAAQAVLKMTKLVTAQEIQK